MKLRSKYRAANLDYLKRLVETYRRSESLEGRRTLLLCISDVVRVLREGRSA